MSALKGLHSGFQFFGKLATHRMFICLDLVTNNGTDRLDMGVNQWPWRGLAVIFCVDQPAQAARQTGNQRIFVG